MSKKTDIPEDMKAHILAEMTAKRNNYQTQLDQCLAKIRTDDQYLADFIMPERDIVRDTEEIEFHGFLDLKRLLNATPDEIITQWYFDGGDDYPVTIKQDIEREMNSLEYAIKVRKLKAQHLAEKRTMYEKDLNKNIKGLKRNIEALTRTINQIAPPPTAEEDLKISLSRLEPGLQADILRKAEALAWAKVREMRQQ